jgi:hypothetical protein
MTKGICWWAEARWQVSAEMLLEFLVAELPAGCQQRPIDICALRHQFESQREKSRRYHTAGRVH